jgi:hypothetical protein
LHHAQPVVIEGDSYRSAKRKTVSSHSAKNAQRSKTVKVGRLHARQN